MTRLRAIKRSPMLDPPGGASCDTLIKTSSAGILERSDFLSFCFPSNSFESQTGVRHAPAHTGQMDFDPFYVQAGAKSSFFAH
jgi:hypothetical protein